jgi:hypothetical protein
MSKFILGRDIGVEALHCNKAYPDIGKPHCMIVYCTETSKLVDVPF